MLVKSAIMYLLLIVCMTAAVRLYGQDGNAKHPMPYTVITKAGDTLTGNFERWAGDTLILQGGGGALLRVFRAEIARVDESAIVMAEAEEQNDAVAEAFRRTPASSLIFFPTAWPKPDGHPVIGVYEFAFASAAVSFEDMVTVSGMTSFVSLLSKDGDIYSISIKLSPVVRDNMALAAGVTFMEGYTEYVDPMQMFHVTGSFMLGAVSVTAGYTLIREERETGSVLYLGSDIPVTKSIRVLLEFAKPNDYGRNAYLIGAAARLQFRRLLIEIGAFSDPEPGGGFIAPWLGLAFIL
jgi:hypothetical protein